MKTKIMNNFSMKILSLVIAFIAWITIINVTDPVVTRTVKGVTVTLINSEELQNREECCDLKDEYRKVDVIIKGKKSVVDDIKSTDFVAEADVSKMSVVHAVPIKINFNKTIRNEPKIINESREMAVITVEKQVTKDFDINVNLAGNVAEGYFADEENVTLSKSNITVSGPETLISEISNLVVKFDVSNLEEEKEKKCKIEAVNSVNENINNGQLKFSQDYVDVKIVPLVKKSIDLKVQTSGKIADDYSIKSVEYNKKNILIAGAKEDIDKAEDVLITVDVTGATKTITKKFDLSKSISSSLKIVQDEKNVGVSVNIEKKVSKRIEFEAKEIHLEGQSEGRYVYYDEDAKLNVDLKGLKSNIEKIGISDIKPYINVKDLSSGKKEVEVQFENNIESIEIEGSTKLEVEILDKEELKKSDDD